MRFGFLALAAFVGLAAAAEEEIKMDVDELLIDKIKAIPDCERSSRNGDTIKVNYKGELLDGKVFDSSWDREPLQFQLGANMVIEGWERGLQDMCVGDVRIITIPSKMAYGPRGAGGGLIPGNAALKFHCELMEIVNYTPAPKVIPDATEAAEPEPEATEAQKDEL